MPVLVEIGVFLFFWGRLINWWVFGVSVGAWINGYSVRVEYVCRVFVSSTHSGRERSNE